MRHTPNLIEIICADTSTTESAIAHLSVALRPAKVHWNYIESVQRIKFAYKGLHSLEQLTAGLRSKAGTDGHRYNKEVTELAAPLAFGRNTHVVDLSPRKFAYAGDRKAAYRLPFFFVEQGIVKAFCLQPRKSGKLTIDQVGGYATVVKKFLLDTEFFGERVDLEFVDLGSPDGKGPRSVDHLCLDDLMLWSEEKLEAHLNVVAEALRFIEDNEIIESKRRPLKVPDLPLFGDL